MADYAIRVTAFSALWEENLFWQLILNARDAKETSDYAVAMLN